MSKTVVIIGASPKPERYSNMAMHELLKNNYPVRLVHPTLTAIEGFPVVNALDQLSEKVDTVTLYVSKEISETMADALIKLNPRRVIFNPGTESETLKKILDEHHILSINQCTLVMLKTKQF